MSKKESKVSGCYGPYFEGDPVIFKGMRWRVASARDVLASKKTVPHGCAPIKPEDEEAEGIVGIEMIPIDDLDRV